MLLCAFSSIKTGILRHSDKRCLGGWKINDVLSVRTYAFTSTVPADDQIILLAGQALDTLSQPDRAALAHRRTVTFGPVGINDERYHPTTPWYAQAIAVALVPDQTVTPSWPGAEPAVRILSYPITAYDGHSLDVSVAWRNLPVTASQSYKLIVQIEIWLRALPNRRPRRWRAPAALPLLASPQRRLPGVGYRQRGRCSSFASACCVC